ncbi:MAG: hypothetical protein ABIH67_02545 [Candidatus Uhrbacteria bacterium]
MSLKDVAKQRLFHWGLFVLLLVLILFGWWKINSSNWRNLDSASIFELETSDQVLEGLHEITEEASQQLNQLEESFTEEYDQTEGQEIPAEVIEAMIEEINNQNNYGEEENGPEKESDPEE